MPPRGQGVMVVAAGALLALLAGCAEPSYQYVSSDENDLVMKVPLSWAKLDKDKVTPPAGDEQAQAGDAGWVVYFDAAGRPDPAHARSESVSSPVLTARSVSLSKEQGAQLTDDQLRDFLTPVTKSAQTSFALSQGNAGLPMPKFRKISENRISTRTARGVHVVVGYDLGAGEEVFDKVVVTNRDKTRLHLLLVHCAISCFERRQVEIESVARSFTVKRT